MRSTRSHNMSMKCDYIDTYKLRQGLTRCRFPHLEVRLGLDVMAKTPVLRGFVSSTPRVFRVNAFGS